MPSAGPEGSLQNPSVVSSNKDTCSAKLRRFGVALETFGSKCFRGDPRTGAFVIGTTSILLSLISLLEAARLDRANASTAVLSGYAGLNAAFLVSALLASLTDQKDLTAIRPWFIFQLILITGLLSFGTVILKVLIPPLEKAAAPSVLTNPTTPVPAKLARELRIAGWGLIGVCGVEVWFLIFVWYNYTKLAHEEHMAGKRIKVEERNHAWVEESVGFGKKQHKGLFHRSHTSPVIVHDDIN